MRRDGGPPLIWNYGQSELRIPPLARIASIFHLQMQALSNGFYRDHLYALDVGERMGEKPCEHVSLKSSPSEHASIGSRKKHNLIPVLQSTKPNRRCIHWFERHHRPHRLSLRTRTLRRSTSFLQRNCLRTVRLPLRLPSEPQSAILSFRGLPLPPLLFIQLDNKPSIPSG